MELKNVTLEELKNELLQITDEINVEVTAITEVKMNKKNNPFYGNVFKKQISNALINFNYAKAVNEQLIKEGKEPNFVSKPRVWGIHIANSPLLEHKGEYYLEARFINNDAKIEYLDKDNNIIEFKTFEQYMPPKKESVESEQSETVKIIMRDFKLSSIKELKTNKFTYIVK